MVRPGQQEQTRLRHNEILHPAMITMQDGSGSSARSHDGCSLNIGHQSVSLPDTKELESLQLLLQRINAAQTPDYRRYDEHSVPRGLRREISFQPPILCALLFRSLVDPNVVRDRYLYEK